MFLTHPLRYYATYYVLRSNAEINKKEIAEQNRNRAIIYQWFNLITGETYVGSAWNGATRLVGYRTPSVLSKNLNIYKNIVEYTHFNFAIGILEDLGTTINLTKIKLLNREQYYLDILFKEYPKEFILNRATRAGSTLGLKHSKEFINNRKGKLNPMFALPKSQEYLNMQKRDKSGVNNPLFGVIKTQDTIAKITKLVYVYKADTLSLVGVYSTVNCSKQFGMGKDTLTKYIKNGLPYKGLLFRRSCLT